MAVKIRSGKTYSKLGFTKRRSAKSFYPKKRYAASRVRTGVASMELRKLQADVQDMERPLQPESQSVTIRGVPKVVPIFAFGAQRYERYARLPVTAAVPPMQGAGDGTNVQVQGPDPRWRKGPKLSVVGVAVHLEVAVSAPVELTGVCCELRPSMGVEPVRMVERQLPNGFHVGSFEDSKEPSLLRLEDTGMDRFGSPFQLERMPTSSEKHPVLYVLSSPDMTPFGAQLAKKPGGPVGKVTWTVNDEKKGRRHQVFSETLHPERTTIVAGPTDTWVAQSVFHVRASWELHMNDSMLSPQGSQMDFQHPLELFLGLRSLVGSDSVDAGKVGELRNVMIKVTYKL